jgi:glutathione S-transferase
MSLTFYTAPMSTAGITEAVLAELQTPCERVTLNLKAGDTKKPEFLKVNPNGTVPAIVHDGTPIWESSAITMYLGETFGVEKKLYPAPGAQRGEAMKWIVWSNVVLANVAGQHAGHLGPDHKVPDAAKAKKAVTDALQILDDGLKGKQFLLGDYTLADTHVQGIVGWIGMLEIDLSAFGNITPWMKRIAERPAMAAAMAG